MLIIFGLGFFLPIFTVIIKVIISELQGSETGTVSLSQEQLFFMALTSLNQEPCRKCSSFSLVGTLGGGGEEMYFCYPPPLRRPSKNHEIAPSCQRHPNLSIFFLPASPSFPCFVSLCGSFCPVCALICPFRNNLEGLHLHKSNIIHQST